MSKPIKCMRCRRPLTNPRSISLGVGPECEAWRSQFIAGCGSSEEELAAIQEHQDETINRWARNFYSDMAKKDERRAKQCLESARQAMSRRSTSQEVCNV